MDAEKLELGTIDGSVVAGATLLSVDRRWWHIASAVLVLAGITLVGASFGLKEFRDGQGILTGKFVLPLSAGVGLLVLGCLAATAWRVFAGWLCVALVGEAASLQMIDAGRLIHFQHYRSLSDLLQQHSFELVFVVLQTCIVVYAIARYLGPIVAWLRSNVGHWKIAIAILFLIFAGAAVTPDLKIYTTSLLLGAWVQVVSLGTVIIMVAAVPDASMERIGAKIDAVVDGSDRRTTTRPRLDRFAVGAALFVVLLAAALSYFVYQAYPHVPDEAQYLFQARYMAAGQLTVKAPAVPEAFSLYMVPYLDDRWYSIFSPGWPAMLAVGVWAGVEWLVNPVLAGVCILLAYVFFQQVYDRRSARIAVILLSCSPWFIFMGMNFMGHMFTLAAALGGAVILLNSLASRRIWMCLLAGGLIGVVSLIRPLDGAIVAVLLGITVLAYSITWRRRILSAAALVSGTIATASLVLPYDMAVTGNAFVMPIDAYYTKYFWPKVMALGFGPERGMGWGLDAFPGHSPLEALINAALNTSLLQTELFGWGVGSLFLITFFVLSGKVRRKDLWAVLSIAVVVLTYGLFWYHGGPDFGARYWFVSIIPLVALTVSGIEWLSRLAPNPVKHRMMLAVLCLVSLTLICYIPWRSADKYYHYLGVDPSIRELARDHHFGKSLILILGSESPDYQTAWTLNPVNFDGDSPIFAFDKGIAVQTRILSSFADRQIWLVDGPSITGGGYRVEAGPMDAEKDLKTGKR
ncbi:MAG: hypothetical protein K1X52_01020 [Pyrinomonadaceae bacterium]|nr:hypothetical protein [Pyrinomonadaceae bacterium]